MIQIKASWISQQPKEYSSRKAPNLLRLMCIYFQLDSIIFQFMQVKKQGDNIV